MFPFHRLAVGVLVVLGSLALSSPRAEAASIYAELKVMGPAYDEPGGVHLGLILSISIGPGWYYGGVGFTGTADANGNLINWEHGNRYFGAEFAELHWFPVGASTVGYYVGADIPLDAPPGVYDRNPNDLTLPATVSVTVYDDDGNRSTDWTTVSYTIQGAVVPEPASAMLLASGLLIPAGAVWLRRRRAG